MHTVQQIMPFSQYILKDQDSKTVTDHSMSDNDHKSDSDEYSGSLILKLSHESLMEQQLLGQIDASKRLTVLMENQTASKDQN